MATRCGFLQQNRNFTEKIMGVIAIKGYDGDIRPTICRYGMTCDIWLNSSHLPTENEMFGCDSFTTSRDILGRPGKKQPFLRGRQML